MDDLLTRNSDKYYRSNNVSAFSGTAGNAAVRSGVGKAADKGPALVIQQPSDIFAITNLVVEKLKAGEAPVVLTLGKASLYLAVMTQFDLLVGREVITEDQRRDIKIKMPPANPEVTPAAPVVAAASSAPKPAVKEAAAPAPAAADPFAGEAPAAADPFAGEAPANDKELDFLLSGKKDKDWMSPG